MPIDPHIRAYEAMLRAVLAALAADARARGVGPRRLARLLAESRIGGTAAEGDLPYDVAVRLISRWANDRPFSRNGRPVPLAVSGRRSFSSLVRAARAGSASQTLRALERMGVVRRSRDGKVVLRDKAFVPHPGSVDRLSIAARHASDFIRLLAHNLTCKPEDVLLQRVASYDRIGASSLNSLRRDLRREGLSSLERANAALAARDRDRNARAPGGRRTRVSFGVYILAEPVGAATRKKK